MSNEDSQYWSCHYWGKNVPFLSLVAWHWYITRVLLLTRVKGSCQQKMKTSPKLAYSISTQGITPSHPLSPLTHCGYMDWERKHSDFWTTDANKLSKCHKLGITGQLEVINFCLRMDFYWRLHNEKTPSNWNIPHNSGCSLLNF